MRAKYLPRGSDVPEPSDDDDDGLEGVEKVSAVEARKWSYIGPGVFGRVVCDEAQKIKSAALIINQMLVHLQPDQKTMLIASPMIRRANDLLGLLRVIWNPSWDVDGDEIPREPDLTSYDEVRDKLVGKNLTRRDIMGHRWVLHPKFFILSPSND